MEGIFTNVIERSNNYSSWILPFLDSYCCLITRLINFDMNEKGPNTQLWMELGGIGMKTIQSYVHSTGLLPVTQAWKTPRLRHKVVNMRKSHIFILFVRIFSHFGAFLFESAKLSDHFSNPILNFVSLEPSKFWNSGS